MAVINITIADDISLIIAAVANPGDVLLVEDGIYNQSVLVTKSNVHIIAKGNGAVFDGLNLLVAAFVLDNISNVTVEGFTIINYTGVGITVGGGSANRILKNRLVDTGVEGIMLDNSTRNVVWRNEASGCTEGILMINGSTANWIIENNCHDNLATGIETFLDEDANNAVISNKCSNNSLNGFGVFGTNSLMLYNKSNGNGIDGFSTFSLDMAMIGNEAFGNNFNGAETDLPFGLILCNELSKNGFSGLSLSSNANIAAENEIECNRDSGIKIDTNNTLNSLIRNKSEDNRPFDIEDLGTNNNYVRNECETSNPPGLCTG
jgi:parallel beta-helix repeat protein